MCFVRFISGILYIGGLRLYNYPAVPDILLSVVAVLPLLAFLHGSGAWSIIVLTMTAGYAFIFLKYTPCSRWHLSTTDGYMTRLDIGKEFRFTRCLLLLDIWFSLLDLMRHLSGMTEQFCIALVFGNRLLTFKRPVHGCIVSQLQKMDVKDGWKTLYAICRVGIHIT